MPDSGIDRFLYIKMISRQFLFIIDQKPDGNINGNS